MIQCQVGDLTRLISYEVLPNYWTYPYAHPIFIDLTEKFILDIRNCK
jgi:hypothetical protein